MTNPISARTLLVTYKQCNLKWTLHACKFPKISFDHLSYAWWYFIKYKTLMKSATVSKDAGFDERKDFWIPPSSYVPSSRNANHFKSCRTPFLRLKRRRRMPWFRNKKKLEMTYRKSLNSLDLRLDLGRNSLKAISTQIYFVREDVFIAV